LIDLKDVLISPLLRVFMLGSSDIPFLSDCLAYYFLEQKDFRHRIAEFGRHLHFRSGSNPILRITREKRVVNVAVWQVVERYSSAKNSYR